MKYELTGKGLFLGYLVLSFLPPIPMIAFATAMIGLYGQNGIQYRILGLIIGAALAFLLVSAVACLIFFGPAWLVLHKFGFRGRSHAFLAAAIVFGAANILMMLNGMAGSTEAEASNFPSIYSAEFWLSLVLPLFIFSLLYGGAALIAWRIAYRRVPVEGA